MNRVAAKYFAAHSTQRTSLFEHSDCAYPPNFSVIAIPHFNSKGQASGDVVQIGIGQFAQQFINAVIELRGCAPKLVAFRAQLLAQAQRVELPVLRLPCS